MGEESSARLAHLSNFRATCPVCEHANPADSRFCNACGAPLYLAPCPRCGSMNNRTATECHDCGATLPSRSTGTLVSPPLAVSPSDETDDASLNPEHADEPIAPRALDGDAPRPLGDAVANPQEALRELRRLMAAPVSNATATGIERHGALMGTGEPDGGVDHQTVSPRPRPPTDIPGKQVPAIAPAASTHRRRTAWIAVAIVLAIAALAGSLAYRSQPSTDAAKSPAATAETTGRGGPTGGGTIVNVESEPVRTAPVAAPSDTAGAPSGGANVRGPSPVPEKAVATTGTAGAAPPDAKGAGSDDAAAPAKARPAPRVAESQRSAGRAPQRSSEPTAAEAALVPPRPTTGTATGIEPPAPRLGPCTEAMAALGLCVQEPVQRRE
jgi:hypothetical protein